MMYCLAAEVPVDLNYKGKAMIDETRAILGRVREQDDDDNEGCFGTKPKVFKSAPDVHLQQNFLIESKSCNGSMVQPLLQQLRAPKAPVRGIALCGSPLFLLSLSGFPHLLLLPHFTFTGYLPGSLMAHSALMAENS